MVEELIKWRDRIDKLDKQILEIVEKRFELVKEIGEYKKTNGLKIFDKKREQKVINNKLKNTNLDKNFVRKLIVLIMDESKRIQGGLK